MRVPVGDDYYEVDFHITEHGAPQSFMEPAEPWLMEIDSVVKNGSEDLPIKEIPDALMQVLEDYIYENYIPEDDIDDYSDGWRD